MPRGPGKKGNYNLDYSRFNGVKTDEDLDIEVLTPEEDETSKEAREMMRRMPPELQEAYRLMAISRSSGDEAAQSRANELAFQAVRKGGPEVRKAFLAEVSQQMPEAASTLRRELDMDDEQVGDGPLDHVTQRIDTLREQMQAGANATRKQLEALEKQQAEMESLSSSEEFVKFMRNQGLSDQDLQRILCGDQAHMEDCVKRMLDTASDVESKKTVPDPERTLQMAEQLHASVCGTVPAAEAEKAVPEKPVRTVVKEPKDEVKIPDYQLRYQKDPEGRFCSVELICPLQGVPDMSCVTLDISEKHLRLITSAPAPLYAVNAGPFPVLIEPAAAQAKFSKKRGELSVLVPAKKGR